MQARLFTFAAAVVLAAAPLAVAQGGGQGSRGQGGRPQGQGHGQGQQQGAGGMQQGRGDMDQTRTRQRIHATDQQRHQFRTCTQSQDRVRTQAHDMAHLAKRQGASSDDARQMREQLREQVRTMQQEHQRLMQGLSGEQQTAARSQIREMERVHSRLRVRMDELDRAVDADPYRAQDVAKQAREVERAMKEWQKQHRKLGDEIGMES